MPSAETTCWTIIEAAARGRRQEREQFAQCYEGPIRAYLTHRWRGSSRFELVDDAVQEVFIECFRADGPLSRADRNRGGGFRAYLFGVVRNVARSLDRRQHGGIRGQEPEPIELDALANNDEALSQIFDRTWAESIMQQAAERQAERAGIAGDKAVRRVELLKLRFQEGLTIREIAQLWHVDAADLHREQTKARREFQTALLDVLAFHCPGSDAEVQREAEALLVMLG